MMVEPQGTLMVTGAGGGIGRAIAERFAADSSDPCTGLFTVRNTSLENARLLRTTLLKSKKPFTIASLELSSLINVRSFATNINARVASGAIAPIRALVLNAGYMSKFGQRFTEDGYEMTFQVNYLANFLLVLLLLQSMDRDCGRIIFITSWTHDPADAHSRALPLRKVMWRPVSDLAVSSVLDTKYNKNQAGLRRYAESKLWLMTFMHALQTRLDTIPELQNIGALSVDPGGVFSTGIMREQAWYLRGPIRMVLNLLTPCMQWAWPNGVLRTAEKSARDILRACFAVDGPVLGKRPKGLYLNGSRLKVSSKESRDVKKQSLLWEGSLKLAGLEEKETALAAERRSTPPTVDEPSIIKHSEHIS